MTSPSSRTPPSQMAKYSLQRARSLQSHPPVGFVGLGDEQHPGGVLVQPVHDAGPKRIASPAELLHVVGHRIGDRVGLETKAGWQTMPACLFNAMIHSSS